MEQIQKLEEKIKLISSIYDNEDGLLKYQYEILNKLFIDFAKKGTYFLLRKQNNSGNKKNYIFVGADNYFETGFWTFDKKIVPYNQNFTIPININFKNGTFAIGTTLQTTKKEVEYFENNILKKIHDKLPDFKETGRNFDTLAKKEEGRIAYSTERMSDFTKLQEYITVIDEILSKIDGVEKISYKEFILIANKRLNYISENKNLINTSNNIIMQKSDKTSQLLDSKKQIILYGPPGTGKTYNVENIIENHSGESYSDLKNDGRVEFITFHQSFSYEEFIEGIKPDLSGDSEEISYKIEDGIFKKVSINALFDDLVFENFQEDLNYTELYDILIDEFKKDNSLLLKSKDNKKIIIKSISDRNSLHCYHENSNVKHTVGKDRLKRIYDKYNSIESLQNLSNMQEEFTNIIGGANQTVYWTVLNKILIYKEELKKENIDTNITYEKKKELIRNNIKNEYKNNKNYYLVIDEINRGNISKIFGELITLLEADKRLGKSNEITTKLPYSKEDFGIPSNLFIVATMNTSDKSIVSLDTALRRRFGFKEMLPDYTLEGLNKDIEGIHLSKLLEKINNRIEYLIDKDHLIGHSYFLKTNDISDLKLVVYNEILPLLEEYFYGEEEKIRKVLGKKLFKPKQLNKNLFEDKEDFENDDNQYEINVELSDDGFVNALKNIIKSNEEN